MAAMKAMREACGGVCEHGGQCRNGECVCRTGWEGEFCEEEEEGVAAELIWFFIITVILVAAALLFFYGSKHKKELQERFGNRGRQGQGRDGLLPEEGGSSDR